MNDSLRIRQIAERKVAECKGDYYRHHYCDLCPMKQVITHYDDWMGAYFDVFICNRLNHLKPKNNREKNPPSNKER